MVGSVANGRETPVGQPELRAAAPHRGGPLASSGAAPEPATATTAAEPAVPTNAALPTGSEDAGSATSSADQRDKSDLTQPAVIPKNKADTTAPADHPSSTGEGSSPTSMGDKSDKGVEAGVAAAEADQTSQPTPAMTEPGASAQAASTAARTEPGASTQSAGGAGVNEPGKSEPSKSEPSKSEPSKTETATSGTSGSGPGAGDKASGPRAGDKASGPGAGDKASGPGSGGNEAPAAVTGLRRANPVRVVRQAGRSTSAWAKRPSGRLVLPGIIALLLLGAAGTAGAYLVPQALEAAPTPSTTPVFPGEATASAPAASLPAGLPTASAPLGSTGLPATTGAPIQQGQNGVRPADALSGWATQVGTKVGIPVVAVQAYGYAELVVARTMPTCHLSWTTIAAIAKVESAHGSANGAVLGADGSVQPPIYGLPLDGKGGRQLIRDTDQGTIDGDTTYDRAVGPLQFVPSTWQSYKVDADNNGVADPNDIDDASLTAATYLCQGGRDMSKAESWWGAILSYNAVQPYAQKVFEAANDYGRRSRA
jgi:hypothetical protein